MSVNNDRIIMYKDSHQELEFAMLDVDIITGSTIVWEMSKKVSTEPLITKTTVNMIIADPNFTVLITPDDNKDLEPGVYYHEARITDNDGNTRPVATGLIEVVETLTESVGE